MKIKYTLSLFAVAAMASFFLSCNKPAVQEAKAPTTDRINMMAADWERAKKFTQAYIDSSDEKSYAFKASATVRTFGDQLLHLAEANYGLIQAATGKASEMGFGKLEGKDGFKSKAEVTKAVMDSYDFAIAAIKDMNDTQLADTISVELFPGFKPTMTREAMINKTFEHQTHHRGQATQYLRAQGKTPPQEMLF